MNLFEVTYNISALIGLTMMTFLLLMSIYSYKHAKTPKDKRKYLLTICVILLLIGVLYLLMTRLSPRTKRVLGALDIANVFI